MLFQRVGYVRTLSGLVAVLALLAMASSANASSLRSTWSGLRYDAAPGEINDLTITATTRAVTFADLGSDDFTRNLPSGCTELPVDIGVSATCNLRGWLAFDINLGDEDDWVHADTMPRRISLLVDGGEGADIVEPGAGNDVIEGKGGDDTLYGGQGNDIVIGGAGFDYVRGNGGNDIVSGGADFDFMFGDGGKDRMTGGGDLDYMFGGGGDDMMDGDAGDDLVRGQGGNDYVSGSGGDDEVFGGLGRDAIDGGAGNDLLRARDGERDSVACGAGMDEARVDAGELDQARRSCEVVKQADAANPDPEDDDEIDYVDDDENRMASKASRSDSAAWVAAYDKYFALRGR